MLFFPNILQNPTSFQIVNAASALGEQCTGSICQVATTGEINNAGQFVGSYLEASGRRGYVAAANGDVTLLTNPSFTAITPTGINDQGQIVGTYKSGSTEGGFVYSNGTYTTLGLNGASVLSVSVGGINDTGDIVGSYISKLPGDQFAFLATPNSPIASTVPEPHALCLLLAGLALLIVRLRQNASRKTFAFEPR